MFCTWTSFGACQWIGLFTRRHIGALAFCQAVFIRMCMCVCVFVYVCMYVCMHVCITGMLTEICIISRHIGARALYSAARQVCVCVYMYICIYTCEKKSVYTYACVYYSYICGNICVCICAYICVYVNVCAHVYAQNIHMNT